MEELEIVREETFKIKVASNSCSVPCCEPFIYHEKFASQSRRYGPMSSLVKYEFQVFTLDVSEGGDRRERDVSK